MKRSLELLTEPARTRTAPVRTVQLKGTRVAVADDGDGVEALRLVGWLVGAGGTLVEDASRERNADTLRIVIRALHPPASAKRSLDADADVVLGSARPEFARWLARSILGDR